MGIVVCCLFWVMQDLYHHPYLDWSRAKSSLGLRLRQVGGLATRVTRVYRQALKTPKT